MLLFSRIHTLFYGVLASVMLFAALPASAQITPQNINDLRFTDVNGQVLSLGQYAGRPMLVHLWATWCAPCVRELPLLLQMHQEYSQYGLTLLPISEDFGIEQVLKFFRSNNITTMPALLDIDSQIFSSLGTRGLPISILIDRYGNEVQRFAGNTNWADPRIRLQLNQLLSR